jgi:hypothetical protein
MLKINSTLTSLNLWGNDVGSAGASPLAEALQMNNTLQTLDLVVIIAIQQRIFVGRIKFLLSTHGTCNAPIAES